MGQWLQRGFDRVKMARHAWFPAKRKDDRIRRFRRARGRCREVQICESDDSCVGHDEWYDSQTGEYLDIFTTEDEYGTIKRFSHRMPLGLRDRPTTPEQEQDSPSPVSLTRYFAAEREDISPTPNHAIVRLDTDDSLGFGNFTQTKFDETVAGLSLHTPPSSRKDSVGKRESQKKLTHRKPASCASNVPQRNVCEVMIQPALQNKRKRKTETREGKSRRSVNRDNVYFDQLIHALSRKYWNSNPANGSKGKRNQCRKVRTCGDTGDDDTTFTNVTDLTTKRDVSTNNESLNMKSVPLCSSINRMQAIAEETLPTGDGATDFDLYEEDDRASESPQSNCPSPNSIRFYQEGSNFDDRSQESQESGSDEELHDYARDLRNKEKKQTNENNNNECAKCRHTDGRNTNGIVLSSGLRKHGATIVKLNMPIDYILSRIRRPGLKVYCYRFWVEANRINWNAFHSRKDRRIEAIGRATTCHIRLKAQTVRQPSGFLKQEVVVYAPTMLALEKCCNLFDEKFPRFYASNDFRKLKHIFATNT